MQDTIINLFYLVSRYVHIVATTLIVGGTLFYEMVVPVAIGELKTEVQLALFARMRWVFRWVVYSSAIALLVTGGSSVYRNVNVLDGRFVRVMEQNAGTEKIQALQDSSILNRPKIWFIAHFVAGTLSLIISVMLVHGGRPPERPIQWMRLNLFILLVAIFLASASRGARQNLFQTVIKDTSITAAHD